MVYKHTLNDKLFIFYKMVLEAALSYRALSHIRSPITLVFRELYHLNTLLHNYVGLHHSFLWAERDTGIIACYFLITVKNRTCKTMGCKVPSHC